MDVPNELRIYKGTTREQVRRALVRVVETDDLRASKRAVSVRQLRAAGAKDQNATTALLRAWRQGALSVADSWDDAPAADGGVAGGEADNGPRAQLEQRVRAAASEGEREAVALEAAALVAGGQLPADAANAIRSLLGDARSSAAKRREIEPPPEDPRKLLLASADAMLVARALDRMVSDERVQRVVAFVAAELDADRLESPNRDEGGAA